MPTDRAQDTEAIRAAISYVLDDVSGAAVASDTRVHLAQDALARLVARLEAAEKEAGEQMGAKVEAQMTLKLVTEALDLPFASLGTGWREATPKILARIETIVDEADRAFRERDAALAAAAPGETEQTP